MPPIPYKHLWPFIRFTNAEVAHAFGLLALRGPVGLGRVVRDAFEWRGLRFRNRVGVAAGFDKDARVVRGIAGLGAGFVEVGTVLAAPHAGNARPRLARVLRERALWNRLGFPSDGVRAVTRRLARARAHAPGLVLGCNIALHPQTVRAATAPSFFARARDELRTLVDALHAHADFFVINLSSPNTRGLRAVLHGANFAAELVVPTRARIAELDARTAATPLLVKLPPEDDTGALWRDDTFAALLEPLCAPSVCDGFVALNSSTQLALRHARAARKDAPGGLSGAPLLPHTLRALTQLRALAPKHLRIGCGGVTRAEDACALLEAGAHLVEIYTGLIYEGPGFLADCADAMRNAHQVPRDTA